MSMPVVALLTVTIGCCLLCVWLFWPGNRERFEEHSRIVLDDTAPAEAREELR